MGSWFQILAELFQNDFIALNSLILNMGFNCGSEVEAEPNLEDIREVLGSAG